MIVELLDKYSTDEFYDLLKDIINHMQEREEDEAGLHMADAVEDDDVDEDEQGKEDDDLVQPFEEFVDRYLDKEGWDSEDEDTLYLDGERLISDTLHMLQKKYPDITYLEE